MQIFYADPGFPDIIRKIFRHTLCKRCDQDLVVFFYFFIDLSHKIIDLSLHWSHGDLRIKKSCRADDLLRAEKFMVRLVSGRGCGHEHHLIDMGLKLLKIQWAVIQGRRQAESIIHQCLLSRPVTEIHAADLRKRDMGLVHDDQEIIREIVEQRTRRLSRCRSHKMTGIVLDSRTEACLSHHLHIKICPFRDSLCLQKLVLTLKKGYLFFHFRKDIFRCPHHLFFRYNIVGRREDRHMFQLRFHLSGQRLDLHDPVHLVPEELDPVRLASRISRKYFQHITSYPEASALEIHLISRVLDIDQLMDHLIPVLLHSGTQRDHHVLIIDRAS